MTAPTPGGLDRDGLRARLAEADNLPWRRVPTTNMVATAVGDDKKIGAVVAIKRVENAALIVAAVNALPDLLDALDKADADRAAAWDEGFEAACEWITANPPPSGIWSDPPRSPYALAGDA